MKKSFAAKAAVMICLCLLLASGCETFVSRRPAPGPGPRMVEKPSLAVRAAEAWDSGDFARSWDLYRKVLGQENIPAELRLLAWERTTLSAIEQRRYLEALEAIPAWRDANPEGENSISGQDADLKAVKGMGEPMLREQRLAKMQADEGSPTRLRALAGVILSVVNLGAGDMNRCLELLRTSWDMAGRGGPGLPADVERYLFEELKGVSSQDLLGLRITIPEAAQNEFPAVILRLEEARRYSLNRDSWAQAMRIIEEIRNSLTDPSLIKTILDPIQEAKGQVFEMGLLLPLTGPFGDIGWKIVRGAGIAQWELAQAGSSVSVNVLNTESANWRQSLGELPENVRIVGGPLRKNVFQNLAEGDLLKQRVFFTFLNGLGQTVEGRDAWRFFSSLQDQISVLIDLAVGGLAVNEMAVLYPDDAFGARMAELFKGQALARGASVQAMKTYPVNDPESWYDLVGQFVESGSFKAVFLPGDWSHAEMLVPNFLYHKKGRMLIMGSSVWGQALSRKAYVVERDFRRTVFPGAWWSENTSPATESLLRRLEEEGLGEADFWVALGYDFVRFAANLGRLAPDSDPAAINARIRSAQAMQWSMAPISWDEAGQARQHLFLFKPTLEGYSATDLDELR